MPTKKKLGAVKEAKPKKKLDCKLEVEINDFVYKGEAETLDQCLKDFVNNPNFPSVVKTRAIIRFSDGKNNGQVIWPTIKARRQLSLISLKPYWSDLIADKFENNLSNS